MCLKDLKSTYYQQKPNTPVFLEVQITEGIFLAVLRAHVEARGAVEAEAIGEQQLKRIDAIREQQLK